MKKIFECDTSKCKMFVIDCERDFVFGVRIFCLISRQKANKKINVRYGSAKQIYSMLKCYRLVIMSQTKKDELYELLEALKNGKV